LVKAAGAFIRKSWHYISPTNGGRSVGIVRLRTKGHGVLKQLECDTDLSTASNIEVRNDIYIYIYIYIHWYVSSCHVFHK
jgi:hypothetical protein